jgi:hypothetical protein
MLFGFGRRPIKRMVAENGETVLGISGNFAERLRRVLRRRLQVF